MNNLNKIKNKISDKESLKNFLDKNRNKKIVFTNGCFDLLHAGHVAYLQEAASLGDKLIVGLNSDASTRRLKGSHRPINPENERKSILEALACVDEVVIFQEDTPLQVIKKIKPDVLVKGGDWTPEQIVGSDFVLDRGGEVKSLKFVEGLSSTNIINKILRAYGR